MNFDGGHVTYRSSSEQYYMIFSKRYFCLAMSSQSRGYTGWQSVWRWTSALCSSWNLSGSVSPCALAITTPKLSRIQKIHGPRMKLIMERHPREKKRTKVYTLKINNRLAYHCDFSKPNHQCYMTNVFSHGKRLFVQSFCKKHFTMFWPLIYPFTIIHQEH